MGAQLRHGAGLHRSAWLQRITIGLSVLLLACVSTACIEAQGVTCGERRCPAGDVCVAAGCATLDEANACVDHSDGASCTTTIGNGTCTGGACRPAVCGDGVLGFGEACDEGLGTSSAGNRETPNATCRQTCQAAKCGDGIVDDAAPGRPPEECDDANSNNADGCHTDCRLPRCGDGIVDRPVEACDNGTANSDAPNAACRTVCVLPGCGDGIKDQAEACDDGNHLDGDGCSANCASNEACGNAILDPGEACDDGNLVNGDGCQSNCKIPRCGDGVVDVNFREQCDDGNHTDGDGCSANCASDERCGNGVVDRAFGEQCDDGAQNSQTPNANCRSNCRIAGCGDGVRDTVFNETCDDGNTHDGDGCSADCGSLEVCGNARIDAAVGETCDVGVYGLSSDGCSSRCRVEIDSWRNDSPTPQSARIGAAMAYDAQRHKMVLFGGAHPFSLAKFNDTWEFDGLMWHQLRSAVGPSARVYHRMIYDSSRRVVVLVGGVTDAGVSGETWEFDGTAWRRPTLTTELTPHAGSAVAFDATRSVTVLFGGANGMASTDTWVYNGTTWAQRTPAAVPPERVHAMAAHVPARGGILLFGGANATTIRQDAWVWNGTTWSELTFATRPPARLAGAMVFDAQRNTTVLVGGIANLSSVGVALSDVWELNNTGWQQQSGAPMGTVFDQAAAYDSDAQRVVQLGGRNGRLANFGITPDTWRYNGSWQAIAARAAPTPRFGVAAAYDPKRGRTVWFGGSDENAGALNETWEYDARGWHLRQPAHQPSPRFLAQMSYDTTRGVMVLFGGLDNNNQALGETWQYDGNDWQRITLATEPPARAAAAMAYDPLLGETILAAGLDANDATLNDTWLFNGTRWQRALLGAIAPRFGGAATFNAALGSVQLFGGRSSRHDGMPLNDMWRFDGNAWQAQTQGNLVPQARSSAMFTYLPERRTVFLAGGDVSAAALNDTWEWNGTAWVRQAPSLNVPARFMAAAAYDPIAHRVIAFGGLSADGSSAETWTYGYANASQLAEACELASEDTDADALTGCADPDCWGTCEPFCAPGATDCAPLRPRCGDGQCSSIENRLICPADCN